MAMSEIARALFGVNGAYLTAEFVFFVLGCFLNYYGGGRRLLSLPTRGDQEEENLKKNTMLTPQQHAPRRDNPAPPRPPSRSHLRLS